MSILMLGRIGDDPTVGFAVDEIKRILGSMDPSFDILIIDKPYRPDLKDVLWVGIDPAFGVKQNEDEDTVCVEVDGIAGMITGSNSRSVLIAAYRFLTENGCRFIRPGRDGEIIPQKKIRDLSAAIRETASYPHRGVCIEGADSYDNILDMIDFLPKVGMNEYFIQFMVPTEFFARWYEHRGSPVLKPEWHSPAQARAVSEGMTAALEKEIKKRSLRYHKVGHGWTCEPFGIDGCGWSSNDTPLTDGQKRVFAEVGGKRGLWGGIPLNTNLCYSNADTRNAVTDAITAYAANNPQVDVIHFWLADDSNNQCECSACRKKRPADWYVKMLNELDEKMTNAGLKTKIVFLIYVDLLWEPETEKIINTDRFILMFAPITRDYGKNYGDYLKYDGKLPPYKRNKLDMPKSLSQNIEHLRRWQAVFDGDSFDFDYHLMWAHVGDIGYEKCAYNLLSDMKDLKKIRLRGMVSCQIQRCFLPSSLPFLAMAAALWDDKTDFDKVANGYYNAAYGEKGGEIRKAIQTLSASCHLYENAEPIWDEPEAVRGLDMLKNAADDSPAFDVLRIYAGYLDLLFGLFRSFSSPDGNIVNASADKLFDFLWKNEPDIQPLLDVQNTVGVINRLIAKHTRK
ncbi:MAG: DUF4838 domain-containing protein [Clostridia bacterium]|nr:DUF4838 domain-containing protein [Clostridia bacterium]